MMSERDTSRDQVYADVAESPFGSISNLYDMDGFPITDFWCEDGLEKNIEDWELCVIYKLRPNPAILVWQV